MRWRGAAESAISLEDVPYDRNSVAPPAKTQRPASIPQKYVRFPGSSKRRARAAEMPAMIAGRRPNHRIPPDTVRNSTPDTGTGCSRTASRAATRIPTANPHASLLHGRFGLAVGKRENNQSMSGLRGRAWFSERPKGRSPVSGIDPNGAPPLGFARSDLLVAEAVGRV